MIGFALLERLNPSDLLDVLLDGVGDAVQQFGPFERGPMPKVVLSHPSRSHRSVDVLWGRQRHVGDVFARHRADQLVNAIAGSFRPLTGEIEREVLSHLSSPSPAPMGLLQPTTGLAGWGFGGPVAYAPILRVG